MRNPVLTKESILKKSGLLFNVQGYKATSLSQITDATGFTKGAIYKHFKNKENLEKETLLYLSASLASHLAKRIREQNNAVDKLRAVFSFFESYISKPPIKGGCPLLNAAIEADDAHPILRKGALKTLTMLRTALVTLLDNGIRFGQLKPTLDKEYYATIIIASLEGAIMMSKLQGDDEDIKRILRHLENLVTEITLTQEMNR